MSVSLTTNEKVIGSMELLRVFFITWAVLLVVFLLFGRAAIGYGIPVWARSLPAWMHSTISVTVLYGWTVPAAIIVTVIWHLIRAH